MISLRRAGGGDPIMVDMTDDSIGQWSEHRRKLRPPLGPLRGTGAWQFRQAGALMGDG